MSERYLLFDDGCCQCRSVATAIEAVAAGKLKAVKLGENEANRLLQQAFPDGWRHVPYLVTVQGDAVRAVTGRRMAAALGLLLGPRGAWRVYSLAIRRRIGRHMHMPARRAALKSAASVALGILGMGMLGRTPAFAREPCDCGCGPHCYDVLDCSGCCSCSPPCYGPAYYQCDYYCCPPYPFIYCDSTLRYIGQVRCV